MPWSVYHENSTALDVVLEQISAEFQHLFYHGIFVPEINRSIHFAVIGVKGDAEFHVDAGRFERSYQTVGHVNSKCMCPWCDANDDFADVSDTPSWYPTVPHLNYCICFLIWCNILCSHIMS